MGPPRCRPTARIRLDLRLGCPVVAQGTVYDREGNYWCCHNIIPRKVRLATHPTRPHDMVVLSKSATLTEALRNAAVEAVVQQNEQDG